MSLFFSMASITLFLLNYYATVPLDYILGISNGLGIAGLILWAAGWELGRKD